MRMLMTIELDTEKSNAAARDGTLGDKIKAILADSRPEAAYFTSVNGRRGGYLLVEMSDASQLPALAEPWFLAFNARVEGLPVMTPDDLAKAAPAIAKAAKDFG